MQLTLLKQRKFSKRFLYTLAFLIPFLGYVSVMICSGHFPFGHSSILYSDTYHQYYPFFLEYRRALRSGNGLLYNWNMGMGVDYLSLIAYYLASPLNLLSVVLPESWMLGYFSLMVPVRLGLAGLFFAIFLDKISPAEGEIHLPFFGGAYGLCAWALGYQWNLMWLDTFALLPLVILGMISMLRERRFLLYTLTLFLSVVSNYYIGLFTCIFVALCFVGYEIVCFKSFKRFLADLGLMFLFSVIAIAMTAFLELPAYIGLSRTQSSVNQFPTGFAMNIAKERTWKGLLDAMRQVAGNTAGGITPTFKEGLPNLYCGILPLILSFQFFATKKFKIREKLYNLFLLVFFMLSFILRVLDYIWHGFHFTNMIPYRFSFLFSFVVLVMAYRAYQNIEECKRWKVIFSALLFGLLAACSNDRKEIVFLVFNLVFLAVYTVLLLIRKRPHRVKEETEDGITVTWVPVDEEGHSWNHRLSLLVCGAMMLEMICSLVCFAIGFGGTIITNYPRGTLDTKAAVSYMKELEADSDFYRAEVTHTQSLNDDALCGYSGITMFSSAVDVRVTKFMYAMGYGAKPTYNRYAFEESSPVANMFLNLKYQIVRDGKIVNSILNRSVYNMGNVFLMENVSYLPLGFMVDPQLSQVDVEGAGAGSFAFQNEIFWAATGQPKAAFREVYDFEASCLNEDTTLTKQAKPGLYTYNSPNADTVNVFFVVPCDGFVCVDIDATKRNDLTIRRNQIDIYSETMSLEQMMAVGDCAAGDLIEIAFTCKAGDDGRLDVSAAVLDTFMFLDEVEKLNQHTLDITEHTGTSLSGTVTAESKGLLYTSIPYNENWHVKVDGKDAEITPVFNAMNGVMLSAGTHTVEFTYVNEEFRLGAMISGCAAVLLLLIAVPAYRPRKKGKFAR